MATGVETAPLSALAKGAHAAVDRDKVVKKQRVPGATLGLVRFSDIKALDLPELVCEHAIRIHQSISKEAMISQKKKHVLLHIVFMAFKAAHIYKEADYFEKTFDVKPRFIARINAAMLIARRQFPCPGDDSISQPVLMYTAIELVRVYCLRFTPLSPSHHAKVEDLLTGLVRDHPELANLYPQKVAAAAIVLYMESNGIKISDRSFSEMVGVTDYYATLRLLRKHMCGG